MNDLREKLDIVGEIEAISGKEAPPRKKSFFWPVDGSNRRAEYALRPRSYFFFTTLKTKLSMRELVEVNNDKIFAHAQFNF